jgi:hypothetical protein
MEKYGYWIFDNDIFYEKKVINGDVQQLFQRQIEVRPYSLKTFKVKICTFTPKLSNQNKVLIWYSVLIGYLYKYEYKIVLKIVLIVKSE